MLSLAAGGNGSGGLAIVVGEVANGDVAIVVSLADDALLVLAMPVVSLVLSVCLYLPL